MWDCFDKSIQESATAFGTALLRACQPVAKVEQDGGGVMLLTEKELEEEISVLDQGIAEGIQNCAYTEWFDSLSNFTFNDVNGLHWDAVDARHTTLLDEAEMHWDMCKWEDEVAQDKLFSENTWDKRGDLQHSVMNRRSEIVGGEVEITKAGRDYLTGTTPYGKVYIPKHLWDGTAFGEGGTITACMKIRFLGFEGCRPERSMPWRAMELYGVGRRYPS